jgi:hypothetical protein
LEQCERFVQLILVPVCQLQFQLRKLTFRKLIFME